jgi:thioredoxin-like negative regulator of GroEL
MGPVIAELQAAGWNVTKIDVDEQPALASRNGVMAMPTFLFFKDGRLVKRITGARSKAVLENELLNLGS